MLMLIGGKKVPASDGKTIDVINPATMQAIDTVPAATEEDINTAVTNAVEGFKEWSAYPIYERLEILRKFKELYLAHAEELAVLIRKEVGKTLAEARACVGWTTDLIDFYIEQSRFVNGDVMKDGSYPGHEKDLVMSVRQPLGVVVAVIPFNYPVDQLSHKAIPALAMGNSVIVKPATETPLADIRYCELLLEAGVPANAIQIVTGYGSKVGTWLAADPRIAKVALTGSTAAGIQVAKICADNMHHTCLELGGNDPLIIFGDADLDAIMGDIVGGRIGNAGQTCCAPKRFIVENTIKQRFIDMLIEKLSLVKMGDPMDAATDMGPVVSLKSAIEVEEQIGIVINQGGKLLLGGKRVNETYIEPTVLDVDKDNDIMKDMEVFGPVFPVVGFDTADEAIEIANSTMYGLCSGVYGKDIETLMRVAREMQAGTCIVNGHANYRTPDQPFGGWKMSGIGREGSVETLKQMSQLKAIMFKKLF